MSFSQRVKDCLARQRGLESAPLEGGAVEIAATRNALLELLYARGLVTASEFSGHAADKLFLARMLDEVGAGPFHPKTRALSELPIPLAESLATEFPGGFVVKPAGGMDSGGEGLYDEADFLAAFTAGPQKFLTTGPEVCALSGLVSSGERFLVQERIGGKENEFRLHTLGQRVVEGATFTRWDQPWEGEAFLRAERALQLFLDRLPPWFTAGQAWSVDVIEGQGFRLVEVNTNRGKRGHWSGDLVNPDVLGAYVRHLESHYGWRFLGASGEALREGRASHEAFVRKFGEAAWEKHQALRKSLK